MISDSLPKLDSQSIKAIIATLTSHRLGKYIQATRGDDQQALRLYVLNTKVSAAVMTDLHYVEVALRNKFDIELTRSFGSCWYRDPKFLALMNVRTKNILLKAERDAGKHLPSGITPFHGKVVAELTFGFWLALTDSQLEHALWVPVLHKIFRKAPKRSGFNQQLEKLRQLRNRVAHHEPIFQLDLTEVQRRIQEVCRLICPFTASLMTATSTIRRQVMSLSKYCKRRGF